MDYKKEIDKQIDKLDNIKYIYGGMTGQKTIERKKQHIEDLL